MDFVPIATSNNSCIVRQSMKETQLFLSTNRIVVLFTCNGFNTLGTVSVVFTWSVTLSIHPSIHPSIFVLLTRWDCFFGYAAIGKSSFPKNDIVFHRGILFHSFPGIGVILRTFIIRESYYRIVYFYLKYNTLKQQTS